MEPRAYNPLDRLELGRSVVRALLARPLIPLEGFVVRRPTKFAGAGLYALYYEGPLGCYEQITPRHGQLGEAPIYVGRARPKGARQGGLGLRSTASEPVLFDRLREHARSIEATARGEGRYPLSLVDFTCRYLVVDDIWVPLGEALLIAYYRPVWNVVLDGFGNHPPGKGRIDQARSPWDTLHPGRVWAARLADHPTSADELAARVSDHLRQTGSPDLDTAPAIDQQVVDALTEEPES